MPGCCCQTGKRPKKSYLPVFAWSCPRNASLLPAGGWGFQNQSWLIETSDSRAQLPLFCSIQIPASPCCPPRSVIHPPPPSIHSASHPLAKAPTSPLLPVSSLLIPCPDPTPFFPLPPKAKSSSFSCPFQEAGDCLWWRQAAKFSAP